MIRALTIALAVVLAACQNVSSPPVADTLVPLEPPPPAGTPPTSSPTATLVSTATPTNPPPTATLTVTADVSPTPIDDRIVVTLSPRVLTDLVPPLHIDVPSDWQTVTDAIVMPDILPPDSPSNPNIIITPDAAGLSVLPFGFYQGPVTGGTGNITILYAFPNIVPLAPNASQNVYADALRLLLLTVIEPECEYAFEEVLDFTVGGLPARGTVFAADDCPDGLPSLGGWFAALNVDGLNFAFYAYTEPREAINGPAAGELQAILDTVVFDFTLIPTAAPVTEITPELADDPPATP